MRSISATDAIYSSAYEGAQLGDIELQLLQAEHEQRFARELQERNERLWEQWRQYLMEQQMLQQQRDEELRLRFRENFGGCEHVEWKKILGRGVCDGCGRHFRVFLNGCRQCGVMICTRCRRVGGSRYGRNFGMVRNVL